METWIIRDLDYHVNDMELAKEAIHQGMAWSEAVKEFNVSQNTLTHQIRSGETNNSGQLPVLSIMGENIIERIQIACDWGFILDGADLCSLVKSYLHRKRIKVPQFKNNYPSRKFV